MNTRLTLVCRLSLVAFLGAGCSLTRVLTRNAVELRSGDSLTQDGLHVKVRALDFKALSTDSRLSKTVTLVDPDTNVKSDVNWVLIPPPVFELRITNNTGHIARMKGIVIKLVDSASNIYDKIDRDHLQSNLDDEFAASARKGMAIDGAAQSQLKAATRQIKMLDENTELLPDMTDTYYVTIDLPVEKTREGIEAWLAQQAVLTLKVFEVPSAVDAAGNVTKRVAFEFPLAVKTYADTYEVGLLGLGSSTLVSSVLVAK